MRIYAEMSGCPRSPPSCCDHARKRSCCLRCTWRRTAVQPASTALPSPGTASRFSFIRPLTTDCCARKTGPTSSYDTFWALEMPQVLLPGRRHWGMPMPLPAHPLACSRPTSRRGQAKSSARPAGGVSGSPLTSVRAASASTRGGARSRTAEQLIGADGGGHQRQDRSGQRTRRRLTGLRIGVGRCRFARQRDRRGTRSQQPRDFALDIMRELARAGLGEVHAVIGTQPADLAFEVRTLAAGSGRLRRQSRPRHRHR